MNKLPLFLFLIVWCPKVYSGILYVDNATGNNAYSGTSAAFAWKTIQHAMDNAQPGDTVYIRSGVYYEELVVNVSGSINNHITFSAYPGETVYIDGNNNAVTLLYIKGHSYLTISGLIFRNTLGNNSAGVLIEGKCSHITFRKNKIHDINWTVSAATIPGSNNNSNPFLIYGTSANTAITDIVIDSNEVYDNITGFSESLTLDGNIDGFSITHNTVHDNTNIGILCAGNYRVSSNSTTDHARNGVVQDNMTFNCISDYATSAGIYVDGGWNIIVERNKSYGNGYGIEIGCEEPGTTSNVTVRDNIVFDNDIAGIAIGGYNFPSTGKVENCLLENNTLYRNDKTNSGSGEVTISKAVNCIFRNNIFYTNAQNIAISSAYSALQGSIFDYNAYYIPTGVAGDLMINFNNNGYTGLSAFQSATSQETGCLFGDPDLTYPNITAPVTIDFSLQAGSPCIDAGMAAHTIVYEERDFTHGNRIVNTIIDIGAHEFGSVYTGIRNEPLPTFRYYPNPVGDRLMIVNTNHVPIRRITLSSLSGLTVLDSGAVDEISIKDLPKGIYVIQISSVGGVFTGKIVKE